MTAPDALAALVYAWGACIFGVALYLSVRDYQATASAASGTTPRVGESDVITAALLTLGIAWLLTNSLIVVLQSYSPSSQRTLQLIAVWLVFSYPPLIVHASVAEHGTVGRRALVLVYLASLALPLWATLSSFGVVAADSRTLNVGLTGALLLAFAFSAVIARRHVRVDAPAPPPASLRPLTIMFVIAAALYLVYPVFTFATTVSIGATIAGTVEVVVRSLPVFFLFFEAYGLLTE